MFNAKFAIISLIYIFAINMYPGITYDFYLYYPFFGMALHFFGGFFVAMLFSKYLKHHLSPDHKITNMLIIIGSAVFIGVIWEFAEYSMIKLIDNPKRIIVDKNLNVVK